MEAIAHLIDWTKLRRCFWFIYPARYISYISSSVTASHPIATSRLIQLD